jgi:hypothetical protein
MSYDLSTRTNSDAPTPMAAGEDHRNDDAMASEADDRFDDQLAQQDHHAGNVALDETPAGIDEATDSSATTEYSQDAQVDQESMPSDLATPPAATIWPDNTVTDMRARWQAVQLRFVDDPAAATGEMQALVNEAVQALSTALASRQRELDSWSSNASHDTEQLRLAVQRYRDFYELLLGH